MSIVDQPPRYRFWVLACWEEESGDPQVRTRWRFSLQDPRTGRRRGFADLEALMAALRRQLEKEG
jgi:hypothetical protein